MNDDKKHMLEHMLGVSETILDAFRMVGCEEFVNNRLKTKEDSERFVELFMDLLGSQSELLVSVLQDDEDKPPQSEDEDPFETELMRLINRHSVENDSNTPDYILAKYLMNCLYAFRAGVGARDAWYGFEPWWHKRVSDDATSVE